MFSVASIKSDVQYQFSANQSKTKAFIKSYVHSNIKIAADAEKGLVVGTHSLWAQDAKNLERVPLYGSALGMTYAISRGEEELIGRFDKWIDSKMR